MGKNIQAIPQINSLRVDSLVTQPPFPNFSPSHNSISNIALPQPKLIPIEEPPAEKQRLVNQSIKVVTQPKLIELSHTDSLQFNLLSTDVEEVNWQMDFNFTTQFNDTAYTLIDPLFFEDNTLKISRKENSKLNNTTRQLTETQQPAFDHERQKTDEKLLINYDWLFGLLVLSVFLVGLIRVRFDRYLKDLFLSLLYPTLKENKLTVVNMSNRFPSYLLGFLFYFNSAIFVFQLSEILHTPFPFGLSGPLIIPVAFLFLFLIFSLKFIFYRVAGNIFGISVTIRRYLMQLADGSRIFGLIILPFILLIPFSTETVAAVLYKMVIVLFSFLYLMQIARAVKNNLTSIFSLYYIILYLCALEIVPLTLLFKVLFK